MLKFGVDEPILAPMPARRRHRRNYNLPGHAHELTFSCYQGYRFLESDRTCRWLADAIESARRDLDFALWAYVFMPTHAHLIIFPRQPVYDIAAIRTAIKRPVGRAGVRWIEERALEWLPRVTRKRNSKTERLFWQSGGGYDRNITEGATLLKMIEYIHMNPVRKRLVEKPEDWKWSSAAHYLAGGETSLPVDPVPPEWSA